MRLPLVALQHGDGDLAAAWLQHYAELGVTDVHVVLVETGPSDEQFTEASRGHPVWVRHRVDSLAEARDRVRAVIEDLSGLWVLLAAGDEFVEFADPSVAAVVRDARRLGQRSVRAPLLPRLRSDGRLDGLATGAILDPHAEFSLCSPDLSSLIGSDAPTARFPLFASGPKIAPHTDPSRSPYPDHLDARLRGVTHHFAWRRRSLDRADRAPRLDLVEPLPLDGAFPYSRRALLERRLLRGATASSIAAAALGRVDRRVRKTIHGALSRNDRSGSPV